MKIGDLIQYRHPQVRMGPGFGLVVEIDNERECGKEEDKYLIHWNSGRRWFVAEDWVEVINCGK